MVKKVFYSLSQFHPHRSKKLTFLFLIAIMLFAFVSCSPEASSGATDSNLLPGEVTPPSESEMVSATDDEIEKVLALTKITDESITTKTIEDTQDSECEFDFGTDGKLTTTGKKTAESFETTLNGQIKKDGLVYKFENVVISVGSSGTTVKSGTAQKDGVAMTEAEILALSSEINPDNEKCVSFTYKTMAIYKVDFMKDEVRIGSKTAVLALTMTKDTASYAEIFDLTVNSDRLQGKMSGSYKGDVSKIGMSKLDMKVDYIALNGRFFDAESISKLGLV